MSHLKNIKIEIDIIEMIVPIHLPNKIPEKIKIGDPNPSRATQATVNIKKQIILIKKLALIKFSKPSCNSL